MFETIFVTFLAGPWSSPWFAGNTLDSAAILLTSGLGAVIAFRGGLFNLGGEGQIYLGGLAASVVLLAAKDARNIFVIMFASLAAAFAAFCAGFLMGAVSGLLKRYTAANELITSFLLSAALTPVADYVIGGPLRAGDTSLLATERFSEKLLLPRLLPPSSLSISIIFALILVLVYSFFMTMTASGYRYRIAGADPAFARYGGIEASRYWTLGMGFSGGLFALAGFFMVAGSYGLCHTGFPGGIGWSAIAVALIASRLSGRHYRREGAALAVAALFFAYIKAGSDAILILTGAAIESTVLIQALILFVVTCRWFRWKKRKRP
jgi:simple sugar transport system permease protein